MILPVSVGVQAGGTPQHLENKEEEENYMLIFGAFYATISGITETETGREGAKR